MDHKDALLIAHATLAAAIIQVRGVQHDEGLKHAWRDAGGVIAAGVSEGKGTSLWERPD